MRTKALGWAAVAVLAGCAARRPAVRPFPVPAAFAVDTWDEVLANPGPIELHSLHTGDFRSKLGLRLNLEHDAARAIDDRKEWAPVYAHLVRHRDEGDILIDAGVHHSFATSGHGNFGGMAVVARFGRAQPQMRIDAQLRALNAEVHTVLFTHLHGDHVSGVPDLPEPDRIRGDASHTQWGFAHDVEPGLVSDRAQAQRTLSRLREFIARYPEVTPIFGHEHPGGPYFDPSATTR